MKGKVCEVAVVGCRVTDRVRVCDYVALQVRDFKHGTVWPIMIVSYETLRKFAEDLAGFCDVLICDEGHRQAQHLILRGIPCC